MEAVTTKGSAPSHNAYTLCVTTHNYPVSQFVNISLEKLQPMSALILIQRTNSQKRWQNSCHLATIFHTVE